MKIIKIYAKFNGNIKILKSREELINEYKSYNDLNSLSLTIKFKEGEITLSLLSACYFILTGKIQREEIK